MTKDYKESKMKDTEGSGGYGWMISGIVIGLLVGLGMYFYSNAKTTPNPEQTDSNGNAVVTDGNTVTNIDTSHEPTGIQEPDPISVVIETARQEQQDRKRATFSYYAVLPNLELDVNVKPVESDNPAAAQQKEINLPAGSYLLQIASFKTEAQAQRSQRNLENKGLNTRIEKKQVKGRDWFRLFAGPTEKPDELKGWKALVEKSGFKPLILKRSQ